MLRGAFRSDVPTPPVNSITLFPKPDGKWYQKDSNGNVVPIGALNPVIGSQRAYIKRVDQINDNSTTFQDYLSLIVNNDQASNVTHEFLATIVFGMGSTNQDPRFRVMLNGVQIDSEYKVEQKDSGNDQRNKTLFWDDIELAPGNNTITIQYASSNSGSQIRVYEAKIRSMRVD